MDAYTIQIHETIKALNEIEAILYNKIVNLGMEGELKEVNDSLAIGESVNFKFSDFMALKDPNVNLLIDIYTEAAFGKEKLKNLFRKEIDNNFLEPYDGEDEDDDDLPF